MALSCTNKPPFPLTKTVDEYRAACNSNDMAKASSYAQEIANYFETKNDIVNSQIWQELVKEATNETHKNHPETEPMFSVPMDDIYKKIIYDAIQEYDIAKRQGDKMQIACQAGLVCAAYLQAHDEKNYIKWKEIQKQDNAAVGVRNY